MEDRKRTLEFLGTINDPPPNSQNSHSLSSTGLYGGTSSVNGWERGRKRGGRGVSSTTSGRGPRRFRPTPTSIPGTLPDPNKLLISVCCSSLWYEECHSVSVDDFPDRLPTSFESMGHYTETFLPFLLEEARESIKSAFADACEQDCFWNVRIMTVQTQGNGWVKIELLPMNFNSAIRPPKLFPNVSVVLTTMSPSKKDPLETVQRSLKKDRTTQALGACPASIITGIILQSDPETGKITLRARPVCEKHTGMDTSRCQELLNDLRNFPNSWLMFPTGGIVTQQREYDILHSLNRIPIIQAILKPDQELKMNIDSVPRKMPMDLGQGIRDFICQTYDASQADAILMCTANFCKEPAMNSMELPGNKNMPIILIQGPPGTGKTHTVQGILNLWHLVQFEQYYKAIIGQYRTQGQYLNTGTRIKKSELTTPRILMKPRILVCAPSNAAIDELLERIVDKGFCDSAGKNYKPNLVRVGAEHAPFSNEARLVLLDNLVNGYMRMTKFEWDHQHGHLQYRIQILNSEIKTLEQRLLMDEKNIDLFAGDLLSKMERLEKMETELSRLDLIETLVNEVCPNERNVREALQVSFLDRAEMVFTTLSSTGKKILSRVNRGFETVLIDEAAQASEVAALQPLIYGCQQCVLVGDPQQLPATILSQKAKELNLERSLFARLQEAGAPVKLLKTQYRMHPLIRSFPSGFFYNNILEDSKTVLERDHELFYDHDLLKPYVVFDVPKGVHERQEGGSLQNQVEADLAVALFRELRDFLIQKQRQAEQDGTEKPKAVRVGVLTPYRSQTQCLTNTFIKKLGPAITEEVKIMTVDSCQGKQLDVVIFSCVRGSPGGSSVGFVSDIRRMNVAITRAKKALWILGNFRTLLRHPAWAELASDAQERECMVVESTAESLFPHHSEQDPEQPLANPFQYEEDQSDLQGVAQPADPRLGLVKAIPQGNPVLGEEENEGKGQDPSDPVLALSTGELQDFNEADSSVAPPSAKTNSSTEETTSAPKRSNPILNETESEALSSRKRLCQNLPVLVVKTKGEAKIIGPPRGQGEATLTVDTPQGLFSIPVEILFQGQEGFQPQLLINDSTGSNSNNKEHRQSKKRPLEDSKLYY